VPKNFEHFEYDDLEEKDFLGKGNFGEVFKVRASILTDIGYPSSNIASIRPKKTSKGSNEKIHTKTS
jgi:hypothetical protein